MTIKEINELNPASLAFLGDAVWEAAVREHIVKAGSRPAGELHKLSVKYVSASAQAGFYQIWEPVLSDEEKAVFKRGRNAEVHIPKSATPAQYHAATGFEALIGYLHLADEAERLHTLFSMILD